jgi:hypothetical protein
MFQVPATCNCNVAGLEHVAIEEVHHVPLGEVKATHYKRSNHAVGVIWSMGFPKSARDLRLADARVELRRDEAAKEKGRS